MGDEPPAAHSLLCLPHTTSASLGRKFDIRICRKPHIARPDPTLSFENHTLRLHRLQRLRSGRTAEKPATPRPVRAERSGSEVEAQANWPWLLRTDLE